MSNSVPLHYLELNDFEDSKSDIPSIILLHGLFGSFSNLRGIANAIKSEYRVFLLDLRNHGTSPWDDEINYVSMAHDIANFCQQHKLNKTSILGHSMGGKVAMATALLFPDLIDKLIVADIAPKKYVHQDEHISYIKACLDIDLSQITQRNQAQQHFVDQTQAPLSVAQFVLQNLIANDDDGSGNKFRWRINFKALINNMENIVDFEDEILNRPSFTNKTLIIHGGNSNYVEPEDKKIIKKLFPKSIVVNIKEANHWLHAEKPQEFNAILKEFLI